MNVESDFQAVRSVFRIKHEVLGEMGDVKNETTRLRELNDWLSRELDFETKYLALVSEAQRLVSERTKGHRVPENLSIEKGDTDEERDSERTGGKQRARECRAAYVSREKIRGKQLAKLRSVYYRNEAGLRVGITFSSEKRGKKGEWFLNLQEGEFDEAVLLCEITRDTVLAISLPKSLLDRHGRSLSRDEKRQVKFNVVRQNNKYFLQIPDPIGPVDVTENVDREILRCPTTSVHEMA